MSAGAPAGILVPLDGSELAEAALWVAARAARRLRAVLHLVTVHVPPPDTDQPDAHRARHDLQGYLRAKADELATTHGARSACAVLHGWPPEALAEYVLANDCGLVIMTAHGRSGVSRSWIGSVTEGLLARAGAPILVLRPGLSPPRDRFDHILVAMDGSAGSGTVLAKAVALGSLDRAMEYTLVRIVEPPTPVSHQAPSQPDPQAQEALRRRRDAAAKALERAALRLRKRGLVMSTRVLVAGAVGERLLELAETLGSDLIAVGTQRRQATERLVLGSVADKVVRGARQPVLVIPVQRRRARAAAHPRRRRTASPARTGGFIHRSPGFHEASATLA